MSLNPPARARRTIRLHSRDGGNRCGRFVLTPKTSTGSVFRCDLVHITTPQARATGLFAWPLSLRQKPIQVGGRREQADQRKTLPGRSGATAFRVGYLHLALRYAQSGRLREKGRVPC